MSSVDVWVSVRVRVIRCRLRLRLRCRCLMSRRVCICVNASSTSVHPNSSTPFSLALASPLASHTQLPPPTLAFTPPRLSLPAFAYSPAGTACCPCVAHNNHTHTSRSPDSGRHSSPQLLARLDLPQARQTTTLRVSCRRFLCAPSPDAQNHDLHEGTPASP